MIGHDPQLATGIDALDHRAEQRWYQSWRITLGGRGTTTATYDPTTSTVAAVGQTSRGSRAEFRLRRLGGRWLGGRSGRHRLGEQPMAPDPTWDFRNPASKTRVLGVLQHQMDELFGLVVEPEHWRDPTACAGWELRDMVGHLLDATDSYLTGFDRVRRGVATGPPVGVGGMAAASDAAARAFRAVPREELLDRLSSETRRLMVELASLSDADWSSLLVPDRYLGPLPAMVIAEGMLGGYTVHGWDVRQGVGAPHAVDGDAADLLVPFVFLLWQATADTSTIVEPFTVGVRTTGRNGGETRVDVSTHGLQLATGDLDGCGATIEVDPGTLVLTAYGRVNGGTVRGDPAVVARFRSLFVAI